MNFKPGNIFLTRNAGDERSNPTPGYFNHAAIYVGNNTVVEAQMHVNNGKWSDDTKFPGAVIKSDLDEFWNRYPIIRVLQLPIDESVADEALQMVGLPYRRISSWFRRQRPDSRGVNCVAVVRRSVMRVTGKDPKWRIPDDIKPPEAQIIMEKLS